MRWRMGPPNQPLHPDVPIPPQGLVRDPPRRNARLQSRLFVLENFRLNLVALIAASHHVQNPPFSDLSPPDDSAT